MTESHQTAEYDTAEKVMVQAIPNAMVRRCVLGQWVRSIEAANTIHLRSPPYSIEEVQRMLMGKQNNPSRNA